MSRAVRRVADLQLVGPDGAVVDIFEPIRSELAATVEDQERFVEQWRTSPLTQ
jgi:hypothetical protein